VVPVHFRNPLRGNLSGFGSFTSLTTEKPFSSIGREQHCRRLNGRVAATCAIDAISVRCNPFHLLVATGVSNLSLLECFALTENAVGFLRVWVWLRTVAAISSVQ
jgi:hypothetical protein